MTQYVQPTQTAVKVEELRLPGLDGMLPGADVKGREKTALEYLVAAENVVMKDYHNKEGIMPEDLGPIYLQIYERVKAELLKNVNFTETDLLDYLEFKLETDGQNKRNGVYESGTTLGLYTGCLLSLLTERNEEAGLPTSFYFDGKGKAFPFLFMGAHKVDELIVNNVNGFAIYSALGVNGGYANHIMMVNSTGMISADFIGVKGGNIGTISVINHNGASCVGSLAGGIGSDNGNVGMVLLSGCKGDTVVPIQAERGGKLGLVLVTHHKGDDIARDLGTYEGNVGLAVMNKIEGKDIGLRCHRTKAETKANVKKLLISNPREHRKPYNEADELVFKDESPERWDEVVQEYNIAQLIKQLTSITKDSTKEEIMEVASQIRAIYELNKPKLDKLLEK